MTSKARATSTAQESETAAAELAAAQGAGTEPVEAQDEVVTTEAEPVAEAEPEQEEFIEHLGFGPYGTEFVDAHVLTRAQVKQLFDGLDIGRAELRWTKNAQKRMLVSTEDLAPEVVEALTSLPEFKLVTRNA